MTFHHLVEILCIQLATTPSVTVFRGSKPKLTIQVRHQGLAIKEHILVVARFTRYTVNGLIHMMFVGHTIDVTRAKQDI